MNAAPPIKCGWLTKYSRGRGTLIRNWKRRYFVLELGILKYYEKKLPSEEPPYGESLKGEVKLQGANAEIDEKANGVYMMMMVIVIMMMI